ncbi:MAG TPA: phytoene/squalene synthase family protein [Thermoleophilaceae bacterium]|nr:phytoene/squalene synthase family protein [Thermoleophilaceae bacterium]
MPAATDPRLSESYRHCRRIHRRHDPTYYWATRRLPVHVRPAVHAIYAFVRVTDEIVDGPKRPPDPAARRAALDRWEAMLADALRGAGGHTDPVVAALADAGRRHRLPLGELNLYFDSMRKDSEPVRMQTWDELELYMQGSAGSVGRILAALLGVPAERRGEFASLALAFQLTNFVRDVREDWDLDRVYLPAEDLQRFGVSVDQIEGRELTPGFRRLVALEVERARSLFRASASAADTVAPGVRRGMRLARSVYLGVLDRTERLDFDVLGRRPSLPPWELARAVAGGLRNGA